jgi:hypothetical protein
VDAELYSATGVRLKQSPMANTVLVTLANGRADSGYIPNDTAFGANTYQVLGSKLKPGCAETAIVNGLLDLIANTQKWNWPEKVVDAVPPVLEPTGQHLGTSVNLFRIAFVRFHDSNSMVGELIVCSG